MPALASIHSAICDALTDMIGTGVKESNMFPKYCSPDYPSKGPIANAGNLKKTLETRWRVASYTAPGF